MGRHGGAARAAARGQRGPWLGGSTSAGRSFVPAGLAPPMSCHRVCGGCGLPASSLGLGLMVRAVQGTLIDVENVCNVYMHAFQREWPFTVNKRSTSTSLTPP